MSADLLGRGRSLLPYAHCKNIEAWWWKTNPPPPPPPQKKKKKKVLDHYLHHNRLCYSHYGVFCSFILLIYSSQKVRRSLKFCSALHILVLHMHRKFDVDSIDSFWDMEKQSTWRKEKKERITGNKKNIKVKNKKSHHYMMTFNKETVWQTLTLCDANYAMKEWSDVKVTIHNLKIFPWTFIWHKLGLNILSRFRDRAAETLPKINANCYSKTRR